MFSFFHFFLFWLLFLLVHVHPTHLAPSALCLCWGWWLEGFCFGCWDACCGCWWDGLESCVIWDDRCRHIYIDFLYFFPCSSIILHLFFFVFDLYFFSSNLSLFFSTPWLIVISRFFLFDSLQILINIFAHFASHGKASIKLRLRNCAEIFPSAYNYIITGSLFGRSFSITSKCPFRLIIDFSLG